MPFTFQRHRTLGEITQQCRAQGVPLNTKFYREGGDTILVGTYPCGYAIFNVFNGRFFGATDKGVSFTSDSIAHDHEPWMQALLNFFMSNDPPPKER